MLGTLLTWSLLRNSTSPLYTFLIFCLNVLDRKSLLGIIHSNITWAWIIQILISDVSIKSKYMRYYLNFIWDGYQAALLAIFLSWFHVIVQFASKSRFLACMVYKSNSANSNKIFTRFLNMYLNLYFIVNLL